MNNWFELDHTVMIWIWENDDLNKGDKFENDLFDSNHDLIHMTRIKTLDDSN